VKKSKGTVRYSARQIDAMRKKGRDRTDLERIDAMTPGEVEALAASDDEGEFDWSNAKVGFPGPKQQLTMRLDKDVIDWFRAQGSGYQTRMNAVLRSFVEAQRQRTQ
jgi:uncharacterized protein (DUF4415 family)